MAFSVDSPWVREYVQNLSRLQLISFRFLAHFLRQKGNGGLGLVWRCWCHDWQCLIHIVPAYFDLLLHPHHSRNPQMIATATSQSSMMPARVIAREVLHLQRRSRRQDIFWQCLFRINSTRSIRYLSSCSMLAGSFGLFESSWCKGGFQPTALDYMKWSYYAKLRKYLA